MSDDELQDSVVPRRDDPDEREAPSAVIHACHSQIKWQVLLAVFFLILAGLVALRIYRFSEQVMLRNKAYGVEDTTVPDCIAAFGAACGILSLLISVAFIRCAAASHALAESRKIGALHRALRRLRAVWRIFSVTMAFAVFTIAGVLIWLKIMQWQSEKQPQSGPRSQSQEQSPSP
jgi:hypothetical protein